MNKRPIPASYRAFLEEVCESCTTNKEAAQKAGLTTTWFRRLCRRAQVRTPVERRTGRKPPWVKGYWEERIVKTNQ